jgi:hypothetical protein
LTGRSRFGRCTRSIRWCSWEIRPRRHCRDTPTCVPYRGAALSWRRTPADECCSLHSV